MLADELRFFGTAVSVWNAAFLTGVVAGYVALLAAWQRLGQAPRFLVLRYLVSVYVAALAAQLFAYAFDAHTTLLPPPGISPAAYYLNPLAGPKTLYGAIVALPAALAVAMLGSGVSRREALDAWMPALATVLAISRVGCLLQGCCHGAVSQSFGMRFPPGSPAYHQHLRADLIDAGSWSLPVVPTQALEAGFLFLLAVWSLAHMGRRPVFVPAVLWYSAFRFVLEFARADVERGLYGPLATSQWIALVVIAVLVLLAPGRGAWSAGERIAALRR